MRTCKKCGKQFEQSRSQRRLVCNSCQAELVREHRAKRVEEDEPGFRIEQFNSRLWSLFRMRRPQYDAMLISQGGVCAICGSTNKSGMTLGVDHNRKCCPTNRSCGKCVRALLCSPCNTSLGGFRDDPVLLRRAIEYLQQFPIG